MSIWIIINFEGAKSAKVARKVFLEQTAKFKLKKKESTKKKKEGKKGERKKGPSSVRPEWRGTQVYYDRSGRPDPPVGGAGFAVFKDGKEITAGFETIPFGTNNEGECKGALIGLREATKMSKEVEVIGDCMILTNAASKGLTVKDVLLDDVLSEIKEQALSSTKIEFTHVFREHNKRADAIATTASISEQDGRMAAICLEWNP